MLIGNDDLTARALEALRGVIRADTRVWTSWAAAALRFAGAIANAAALALFALTVAFARRWTTRAPQR